MALLERLALSAVEAPDNWTLGAGANKVVAVALPDDENTSYIFATVLTAVEQQYDVAARTKIYAKIDSVTFRTRHIRTNPAAGAQYAKRMIVGASTVDLAAIGAPITYEDHDWNRTTQPDGSAWTMAAIDALKVRLIESSGLGIGDMRITTGHIDVYGTPGGSGCWLPVLGAGILNALPVPRIFAVKPSPIRRPVLRVYPAWLLA